MLPIGTNCCCVERKADLMESLRTITYAPMWFDARVGVGTYPRSSLLVPCRTCDSTSSQCQSEEF